MSRLWTTTWSCTTTSTTSRSSRSAWLRQELYCGERDSEEDFARHIVDECYDLERTMGLSPLALCSAKNLAQYFDYEAFFAKAKRQVDDGRELFMYDYSMGANNHVFRRI